MNRAKTFVAATLLVFVISLTAFAGDQQTPGYLPPPPSSMMSCTTSETDQDTTDLAQATEVETSDTLWFEALTTLLSVY